MRTFHRMMVLLGLTVLPLLALAAPRVTFEWTLPEKRVDGRPLAPTEIDRVEIRCESPQSSTGALVWQAQGAESSLVLGADEFFQVGAVQSCAARVVDVNGLASQWSDPLRVERLANPSAPQLFRFTLQLSD